MRFLVEIDTDNAEITRAELERAIRVVFHKPAARVAEVGPSLRDVKQAHKGLGGSGS